MELLGQVLRKHVNNACACRMLCVNLAGALYLGFVVCAYSSPNTSCSSVNQTGLDFAVYRRASSPSTVFFTIYRLG